MPITLRHSLHAPTQLDEALALLERYGDDAKVLAGGQSLMPLLNFRLSDPSVLIDINPVAERGRRTDRSALAR